MASKYGIPTRSELRAMLEKQQFRCWFTNRALAPETAAIDHMIPVSKGGTHSIDNLCLVHTDVNRAKNTMSVDEFIALCREVTEHRGGLAQASRM